MLSPRGIFPLLGPKFANPRPIQVEVLASLMDSGSRLSMVEAPVGVGKSAIALAYGKMLGSPLTVVVTGTLSLQDQYVRDFPGTLALRGRGNYKCTKLRGASAAEGMCILNPKCTCDSEYYQQEAAFEDAEQVVTNYALYCSELLSGRRWAERPPYLLVCDEGHRLLEFLTKAEEVGLDMDLAQEVGLDAPDIHTLEEAKRWSNKYFKLVKSRLHTALEIARDPVRARKLVRLYRGMQGVKETDSDLLVTRRGRRFTACPIWPVTSAGSLKTSCTHVLLLSATLYGGSFYQNLLGLGNEPMHYSSLPSPFPTERWPVFYRPVARLSKRSPASDWEKVGAAAHDIMHGRHGEKGIIHVASRSQGELLARNILACPECRPRIVLLRVGERRTETLERYRMGGNTWIIHSSLGEGESFDDDQCRTQIIAKVPFLDLGDPLTKVRLETGSLGKDYYYSATAARIAQMSGRGMRHEADHCETFILDGSFGYLYDTHKEKFPLWFQRQLR